MHWGRRRNTAVPAMLSEAHAKLAAGDKFELR